MADNQNNYSNHSPPPPPPKLHLPFFTRLKLFLLTLFRPLYIRRRDGTINRRLLSLLDFKASAPATKLIAAPYPRRVRVSTSDVTIDPPRNLWFRLFTPAQSSSSSSPLPLIVYYHGGGFTNYGPDSNHFDYLCTHIAAKVPAVVASVNYRLAPEHRYPVQYEDSFDALKFIDQVEAAVPAADPKNCFIAGDSAGGNIAHHVAVRACHNSHEFRRIKIQGLLLLQPFFGGEERTESELRLVNAPVLNVEGTDWMWSCFLPEGANRDHPAARVFGGGCGSNSNSNNHIIHTPSLEKIIEFPRVLVVQGGYDPLLDWQKKYVEWLNNCGKQVESIHYPNAFHGFYAFPELPEFQLLISCVSDFIQRQLL